MKGNVVIIGPAHPLRGGLASFNQRLALAFTQQGYDCRIYSFSLQYPGFLFPGTTQYSTEPPPEGINISSAINSIYPLNWIAVGRRLKKMNPDLILVRYWLPFMGPALGTILRYAKKNGHTKIIAITDNILPHEKRPGDRPFTKYFLKACDGFITMSAKVMNDLRAFEPSKPALQVLHPLYDNFGPVVSKAEAREHLGIPNENKLLLFFGFIRKYKGLDLLLQAMADERIKKQGIKLLVAGEFYEDAAGYTSLIDQLNIRESLILRTDFIPDSEVACYLCAADGVVQPYRNATQSGVTPLAYHYERPMIVTDVGGLPALVPDGLCGVVTKPDPTSIADAILRFYAMGEEVFIPHLREEKKKYSWENLIANIEQIKNDIQK